MSIHQGADERRIASLLRQHGVGPDAEPPLVVPPMPTVRPRDWLDDILESDGPSAPPLLVELVPEAPAPSEPRKTKPKKPKKTRPSNRGEGYNPLAARSPRQSLLDAYDRVPPRVRWLGYHATAAYMGWTLGLVNWSTYVTTWIAHTGPIGPQAVFWYATAGATVLVYRRTRGWWWPLAWLAAIPVCSTVTGVLLYAPTS